MLVGKKWNFSIQCDSVQFLTTRSTRLQVVQVSYAPMMQNKYLKSTYKYNSIWTLGILGRSCVGVCSVISETCMIYIRKRYSWTLVLSIQKFVFPAVSSPQSASQDLQSWNMMSQSHWMTLENLIVSLCKTESSLSALLFTVIPGESANVLCLCLRATRDRQGGQGEMPESMVGLKGNVTRNSGCYIDSNGRRCRLSLSAMSGTWGRKREKTPEK